jgi:hypothetical protein
MAIATMSMRAALKTVFIGRKWARKVDKMPDDQVVAIYRRLQQQNKL